MAVKDVKEYYFKMLAQYLEMKADLADFEFALKEGFITESQMQEAINEVNKIQQNYDRLTYIMYLLELPRRNSKKDKYNKANKKLLEAFKDKAATSDAVMLENTSALKAFRDEIKQLQKENKNK